MAWIESHQSLATHRKTKALKRLLKIKVPQAVGHLHLLWWWCLDNAPDGSLKNIDNEDLSDAACWEKDPNIFVNALISVGFIDKNDRTLHDWYEYAGKLIDRRKANAERQQAHRNALRNNDITDTSQERNIATVPTVPTVPINNTVTDITSNVILTKDSYGEFNNVFLTEEEYDKLKDKMGKAKTDDLIEQLSTYMKQSPKNEKKYKDHYATLKNWSRMDNRKDTKNKHDANYYTGGKYGHAVQS